MELRNLKTFVYVVNYQSFSIAAKKLFLSQPTISTHIKLLEDELKVCLIRRINNKVIPTTQGNILYNYAKKILSYEDEIINKLVAPKNTITIGASTIPSTYCLPEIIQKFNENNDVAYNITQDSSQSIIELLHNGLIDIGLIGMNYSHNDISCVPFYKDKLVLISQKGTFKNINNQNFDYLYKNNKEFKETFSKMPQILRKNGSGSQMSAQVLLEKIGIETGNLPILGHMSNQDTIIKLVINGLGIAIISYKAIEEYYKNDEIDVIFFNNKKSERELNIIYSNKIPLLPITQKFIHFIKTFYND